MIFTSIMPTYFGHLIILFYICDKNLFYISLIKMQSKIIHQILFTINFYHILLGFIKPMSNSILFDWYDIVYFGPQMLARMDLLLFSFPKDLVLIRVGLVFGYQTFLCLTSDMGLRLTSLRYLHRIQTLEKISLFFLKHNFQINYITCAPISVILNYKFEIDKWYKSYTYNSWYFL